MLHTLAILAASAEGEESSKAAYYIGGGLFAAWAVVLAVIGMTRPGFPQSNGQARGVMALSTVLMVVAMATAVITS